jgi:hypothetical protein
VVTFRICKQQHRQIFAVMPAINRYQVANTPGLRRSQFHWQLARISPSGF